jgi:hypothetical protein
MSIEASTTLKNDIKNILNGLKDYKGDQEDAIDQFATQLADKVADAIKRGIDSATIKQDQMAGSYPITGTLTITATK